MIAIFAVEEGREAWEGELVEDDRNLRMMTRTMMTTEGVPRVRFRRGLFLGVAGLVVAADVATKQVAIAVWDEDPATLLGGAVRLTESRNAGAAFGLGTSVTPLLSVFAAAVVVAILACSKRYKTARFAACMGLLLGGAAGNLVDRVFRSPGPLRGHVVDWIDIGSWPNFNLADSALTLGCAFLFLALLRPVPPTDTPEVAPDAADGSGAPEDPRHR